MNLKVNDPDLFLTYLSRSDMSLESLLARYQLHNSPDQLQNGTVDAFWTSFKVTDRELCLTYFSKPHKYLEGLLATMVQFGHMGSISNKSKVNDLHLFYS